MRKSFKKVVAAVLVAAMAFSTPIAVNKTVADAAVVEDDASGVTTLVGKKWWSTENGNSQQYEITDGVWEMYVVPTGDPTDFGVELLEDPAGEEGGHFFTTLTNRDGWMAGPEGWTAPAVTKTSPALLDGEEKLPTLIKGHIYKVSVKIEEGIATVVYHDTTADREYMRFVGDVVDFVAPKVHIISQFGTIKISKDKTLLESLISAPTAAITEDATKAVIGYTVDMAADSVEIAVNGKKVASTADENITIADGKGSIDYVPEASGTYEITITAKKAGLPDDVETVTLIVDKAEDGKLLYANDLVTGLAAAKGTDAYTVTFAKAFEDVTVDSVKVTDATGKEVAVDANNAVKFTDLTDGKEYTVTVTASKEGYLTKAYTCKFTYKADKIDAAGEGVKRTEIKKVVGELDYSTGWFPADDKYFKAFKIEDKMKYTFVFENHSPGTQNYQNFMLMFTNEAEKYTEKTRPASWVEYAVVRSDNWGWGGGDNRTLSGKEITYDNSIITAGGSWDDWKAIMKDADITMDVVRSGAEIQILANIVSQADATKKMTYKVNLNAANADGSAPNPLYMAFTVDSAYLNLKYVDEQASELVLGPSQDVEAPVRAKQMMIKSISAKAGAKKVTGEVNASNATIQVKVGKKAWKKATVSGKKFTLKTAKLAIGTKIQVKATAEGYTTAEKSMTVKGTMKLSAIKAKKGSKKITAKVSVKKATVKVKVGKAKYKKATVKGKKITFKVKKALKKGTKVKIKVTKKNYKTLTKSVKVK